jgi:hypothetical protein
MVSPGKTEKDRQRMAPGKSQKLLASNFQAIGVPWTRLPSTLGPWAALGLPGRKRDPGANVIPPRIPPNGQLAKGRSEMRELNGEPNRPSDLAANEPLTGFLTHA